MPIIELASLPFFWGLPRFFFVVGNRGTLLGFSLRVQQLQQKSNSAIAEVSLTVTSEFCDLQYVMPCRQPLSASNGNLQSKGPSAPGHFFVEIVIGIKYVANAAGASLIEQRSAHADFGRTRISRLRAVAWSVRTWGQTRCRRRAQGEG